MQSQALRQEDPLGKEMATHSSVLAWKIPWTEEAGGLQSWGHKNQTRLSNTFTFSQLLHKEEVALKHGP